MGVNERAEVFVKKIEDGTLQKQHLVNHGFDYSNGPEDIACMRFTRYVGSCGYRLMLHRIQTEAQVYRG